MVIELIFDTQQVFGTVCGQVGELAEGMTFIAPSLPKWNWGGRIQVDIATISASFSWGII